MNDLRPPATGTEAYLAAILDELRVISAAVGGGGTQEPPIGAAVPVDGMGEVTPAAQPVAEPSVTPTKRTRQRAPRTT